MLCSFEEGNGAIAAIQQPGCFKKKTNKTKKNPKKLRKAAVFCFVRASTCNCGFLNVILYTVCNSFFSSLNL